MIQEKSRLLGFCLSLLLGPLGNLYASWVLALIMLVLQLLLWWTVVSIPVLWIIGIACSDHAIHKHNKAVKKFFRAGL